VMPRLRGLLPGLLLIVVLPLTLVLIVVAIGATTLHQNEMRNLIATHDQRAAREAAAGLDERISHQLASLRSIADGVALGLSPADELRSSDNLLSDFEGGVVVIGSHNVVLTSLPQPPDQKLLSEVMNANPTATGLSLTPSGDILAIVRSTDNTITAAGSFSARALRLPILANTLRSSPRTRLMVVDTGTHIVYDSSGTPVGAEAAAEPGVTESLRGESGATFITDENQIEWVVAFEPVPAANWGLIIAEPWEDVVNPLLRTSLLTPLVLVPAFVIAVIAIVFVARRVLRPLQQLDEQAERVGQGDYAALAQPIDGINEIQTLHATLAHMADQIRRYQRSIQSYAADITRSQEDERSRLARELHDVTVQALIALDQRTQMIERTYRRDPQAAVTKLTELRAMTAEAIEEVRRVIRDLRPIYLEDLGLAPALEMLTQAISQPDGLIASFTVEGNTQRLTPEAEMAVYRIAQETLNNVVKHARAKHVQVKLKYAAELQLLISDDGVGFDVPDRVDALTELGHFGLIGMRERAELIGAKLIIQATPGQGTTIELHLPL
jgi:two-component system sensor histidine kinase UhpB